jgi:hypothetical protein
VRVTRREISRLLGSIHSCVLCSLFRERAALQNVKDIREEEQLRIANKQKKHETFLRNQLLDELHTDFVHGVVKPISVLTGIRILLNSSERFQFMTNRLRLQKEPFYSAIISAVEEDTDECVMQIYVTYLYLVL